MNLGLISLIALLAAIVIGFVRKANIGILCIGFSMILGLVYGITVDGQNHAVIDMTLTSAACPLTDVIEDQTQQSLEGLVASYRVNWVWMPPWGPDKITDDGREQLRALGFNI